MMSDFNTRHYTAIAEELRGLDLHDYVEVMQHDACKRAVARRLADVFERDNPRFRRDVFYDACGV